jgi:hypothetical protein
MMQPNASPWTLRAWPPILWQACRHSGLQFRHIGTYVTSPEDRAGQTIWGGPAEDGAAGVAWDWVQLPRGAVAMADPMAVVTNLRLLGDEGEVLTAHEAACFLNEIVHRLPWQQEVQRALGASARYAPQSALS